MSAEIDRGPVGPVAPDHPLAGLRLSDDARARITEEALRLNDRFLHEVIERHSFCPYARSARRESRTKRYVLFDAPTSERVVELLARIAADPSQEVSQMIFPCVDLAPWPWREQVRLLEAALTSYDDGRHHNVLASAAFHPETPFSNESPGRLVMLFRRAPDPTIQWTRLDVLQDLKGDDARSAHFLDVSGMTPEEILAHLSHLRPPLSERIAMANLRTVERLGLEHVVTLLDAIAHDRAQTYQRLRQTLSED